MKSFSQFLAEAGLKGDLQKVKDSVIEWLEDQDVRLKRVISKMEYLEISSA